MDLGKQTEGFEFMDPRRAPKLCWLSFIVTFSLLRWTKVLLFHCKQLQCVTIDLREKLILEKLNSLDLSKSPGPDLLHPRVLYEVRHELGLVYSLKLIFERSLKDQQLITKRLEK